jgi:hypothetical protein
MTLAENERSEVTKRKWNYPRSEAKWDYKLSQSFPGVAKSLS